MQFAKWQGLGNDYVIVEADVLPLLTPRAIALICDRHFGVGADGILVNAPPTGELPGAVARMRIFNPDGSEPEMCGNGIRMFARYLRGCGAVAADEFVVETLAGPITPRLLEDGRVRVQMGRARFLSDSIALDSSPDAAAEQAPHAGTATPGDDVVQRVLQAGGREYEYTFVDVGNPHCIILADDLAATPLETAGPDIETLSLFPRRVNVEFIKPEADGSVSMRVWERGVGETQACGTGATAVGAAAVRLGLAESPVLVHLKGGDLEIEVAPDWSVTMTGAAEEVYTGALSPELLARLTA
jgi:diaminopimelate epimerase